MKTPTLQKITPVLLASLYLFIAPAQAQETAPPTPTPESIERIRLGMKAVVEIPQEKIDALEESLVAPAEESSAARQRLAVKRIIRDGTQLLGSHPAAPNRFGVLSLLFRAQQKLFGMDDSARNREALLETCEALAKAPDEYAHLRLDADLLLTQSELARKGADADARLEALLPMVARYRHTPGDAKMLRVALVMALETGNPKIIRDLRAEMADRFAGDLEMIAFQRQKLGGQIFGAPFCGTFERSDGGVVHLPGDALGKLTILYFWSQEDPESDRLQRLGRRLESKENRNLRPAPIRQLQRRRAPRRRRKNPPRPRRGLARPAPARRPRKSFLQNIPPKGPPT